ncbi:acyltransferase [Fibrobacter sp. UWB5]|uniref:acyltransferase family protein n=1 Tax=Fibrobacter sp. UWB5 TaxID=1964360 RepID=UPI000B51F909|nr:acyltransferase [Fibrobacter sp. UWB5]OWV14377.1 hypothetical protein B7989_02670 [Fibrobacter sp. UWB5]
MKSISPELSSRISSLSFVCACMVVLIHVPVPSTTGSWGWYLSSIFSYGVCLISVPFFFIISGFFLGRHLDEDGWYKKALKKRVRSLLIPYIVFNALYWGLTHVDFELWNMKNIVVGIVGYPFGYPSLGPTWYIRSLLIFVALSPLLSHRLLLTGGGTFIVAIFFLILSDYNPDLKIIKLLKYTFSIQNLFYFVTGLILSKRNLLVSQSLAKFAAASAFVILIFKVYFESRGFAIPTIWRLLFCPLTLIAFWKLFPKVNMSENITALAFPIFLLHYFSLIVLTKMNLDYNSAFGFIGGYAFMLISSLCVSFLIRRILPDKIISFMFGGR